MNYIHWGVDPIFLKFGPFTIRWYGVLFVGGILIGSKILEWIYKREKKDPSSIDDFLIYMIVCVVIGARLVHTLVYEPDYFLAHPIEILKVWHGGLASHGGMLGALVATYLYSKKYNIEFDWLISRLMVPGALAAVFVRIGNLFNSEILGKPAPEVPWAIVFDRIDQIPRHPVQLYEAFAYLIIFFILLFVYLKSSPQKATKLLGGLFMVLVFGVRFFLEFFKTRQADYILDIPLTVGQLLSIPFILLGIIWLIIANKVSKD